MEVKELKMKITEIQKARVQHVGIVAIQQ